MLKRKSSFLIASSLKFIAYIFLLTGSLGILVGCDSNSSVPLPINQKVVEFKKKVKKTVSRSLKAQKIDLAQKTKKHKNPPLILTEKKKNKIKKIHYVSKIAELRDPFIPFIKFMEKGEGRAKPKKPLSPLQKFSLSQLTLIAIIDAGKGGKWAMVEDSAGKGYTIREGMFLGSEGGIVKRILSDQIIVERKKVDLLGKKKIEEIALKLHPEKKGE